jgi:hypothetical protein
MRENRTMNKSLEIYLNDHLAGSQGAMELFQRCISESAGTPLAKSLERVLAEVEEDAQTLQQLMERAEVVRNPFKQAVAWLGEKVSRLKLGSGEQALSNLLSLETLSLGVEGKRCLWRALAQIQDKEEAFAGVDFARLIQRAESQRDDLEHLRLSLAGVALATPADVSR